MSPVCLDDETLAAYVDGRIEPGKRQEVETHLASCEDCYELLSELLHQEKETQTGKVVQLAQKRTSAFSWNRRTAIAGGALVAIAASLVIVVFNSRSPLTPLVQAVGEERLTIARPTGGFQYGPLRSRTRGSSTADGRVAVLAEATELRQRALSSATPANQHAWGIAQMLTGEIAGSLSTLDDVRRASPDVAAYHADYGAAALTRFFDDRRNEDAARAIEALDRATALDPSLAEAWFNKGLLLEALGQRAEAAKAWDKYVEIDSSSAWSDEARRRRDALAKH